MDMANTNEWDAKFKSFLKKAGDDFKRAAVDVRTEAERLMKEVQDPQRQARVRESVQEASVWAKKTADQLASLVEVGVKQAEGALSEVAKQFKPSREATPPAPQPRAEEPRAKSAPAPSAPAEAPAPAAPKKAKKTIGRGTGKRAGGAAKPTARKSLGKKKPAPPAEGA